MSFTPNELTPGDKRVLINSIDVSSYVNSLAIETPQFGVSTANIVFSKDIDNLMEIPMGGIVEIYLGPYNTTLTKKFNGTLLVKSYDLSGYSVSASDDLWKATGATVIKLYDTQDPYDVFGGDFREICIDIAQLSGLNMTDATIDQTSTVIPQVLCDNVKGMQKLTELSQVLYWDLWYNSTDGYTYMTNPENYPIYPTLLEVSTNVVESPNYNENIYQVINEVEVQGVQAYPSYIESFTGDGSTKVYTLAKKPIATYVKVTVDGTVQTGAVEGSTGTYDYTVNLNQSIITFKTAPAGASSILIEYTVSELTNITVDNPDSKDTTNGPRKLVVVLPDVLSVDDATVRAQAILNESKESFSNFTVKAYNVPDLTPRYKINFNDPVKNKSFSNLAVVKTKDSWPEPLVEITLGKSAVSYNNLLMTSEERVKKLERNRRQSVLLNVNKLLDAPYYFFLEDVKFERKQISGSNYFIVGDLSQGVLGVSALGDPDSTYVPIMKRKYTWATSTELAEGTSDANIDVSTGTIKFV